MMMRTIVITFWSLRYLRPSMVYWRVHRTIKGYLIRFLEKAAVAKLFRERTGALSAHPFPLLTSRYHSEGIDLATGSVCFLRDRVTLPRDGARRLLLVRSKPLLWQFHFDYHDWLCAVIEEENRTMESMEAVLVFLDEWRSDHPLHGVGARTSAWHPYVLSIRIEAWIRVYALCSRSGIPTTDPRLLGLLRGVEHMTRVLLRNMEYGTMANHLFRNIKALCLSGLFLDHPTGRNAIRTAVPLLECELREQILDDGMHFERSPMYHVSILSDVLDLVEVFQSLAHTPPDGLLAAAGRMTAFLHSILHPDGEIPFFNDATTPGTLRTNEVLERAETILGASPPDRQKTMTGRPSRVSGLMHFRSRELFVVFDAGNVGPDYQPGHAHCDTLSLELSYRGSRVVTDTGVYHYQESPERSNSRSTAAHNTIRIDGVEQSEVWKSFRVGRRAKILRQEMKETNGLTIMHAAHDGYRRVQHDLIHERFLVINPDAWILVADVVHGSGEHLVEGFVHLHPDVQISQKEHVILCSIGESHWKVLGRSGAQPQCITTEYYPAFGVKQNRTAIVIQEHVRLPAVAGCVIDFSGAWSDLNMILSERHLSIPSAPTGAIALQCFHF